MKSHSIIMILIVSTAIPGVWIMSATGPEVHQVQFGSTVSLVCEFSYLYETTWLKHNPDLTPTVVLHTSLKEGVPAQGPGPQPSPRFSAVLANRSLALQISDVEEKDLGLYYCIAKVNRFIKVGRGSRLQVNTQQDTYTGFPHHERSTPHLDITDPVFSVSSPGSSWVFFYQWYCGFVLSGLLLMVLVVCITHWKTKKATKRRTNTQQLSASTETAPKPAMRSHCK